MYYDYEQGSEIMGCLCTLLYPYKGYSEGEIVGDFGYSVVVRLTNGKELVVDRDELIIYND